MKHLSKSRKLKSNSRILIPLAVIIIIIVGVVILAVSRKSTPPVISAQHVDTTKEQQAAAPNTVVTNPTPTPTTNVPGGSTGESDTSQATLTAPSGTFVSNHGDDSAHPVTSSTTELSACTTTPGATCDIKFTNSQSGTVTDLGVQQTSTTGTETQSPGTVSWTWTAAQENLSPGTWTIEAVATLDGQTKTTTDPISLTISP